MGQFQKCGLDSGLELLKNLINPYEKTMKNAAGASCKFLY